MRKGAGARSTPWLLFSLILLAVIAFAEGSPRLAATGISLDHPQEQGHEQSGPQPPCGVGAYPYPAYPNLDAPANVKSWGKSDLGDDWKPPACTGWAGNGFTTLVATAARFRQASRPEDLLRHIGAISELRGIRYWSTTHKEWKTLIVDAYALSDPSREDRRQNFRPDEMQPGKPLYFEQVDNLSGKATYRLRIDQISANRVVFDIENISTLHYLFVPILHPGEMQSVYFLDRDSDDVWRYYSIVRTGEHASRLIAGNESSSVNRAVAFYRHFVGIPTDQDPPAAR
jgi:hypothetical protein